MVKKKHKHPSFAETTKNLQQKRPATDGDPNAYLKMHPAWRLKSIDNAWDYGWSKIGQERWCNDVLPKLYDLETMTWAGIQQTGKSHFLPLSAFEKSAQKRLEELGLGDLDEIFSLRLQGKHRIYGWRMENVLHVIWFDFDHALVPAPKKHT
jgi:hypothetical protein